MANPPITEDSPWKQVGVALSATWVRVPQRNGNGRGRDGPVIIHSFEETIFQLIKKRKINAMSFEMKIFTIRLCSITFISDDILLVAVPS
jgi:hypothetical protein